MLAMRDIAATLLCAGSVATGIALTSCQSSLDLDQYAFESRARDAGGRAEPPPDGGSDPGDAGQTGECAAGPFGCELSDAGASACGACELPHAESVCAAGACVITRCVGPWLDSNTVAADGCERGEIPEAGLSLWLMADVGVVESDGRVSAWRDQSPNELVATQAAPSRMPERVVTTGGEPMLQFDGLDDALRLPAGFSELQGAGFFAVVEALPNAGCAGLLSLSNGTGVDDVEFGRHTPSLLYYEVFDTFVQGVAEAFVAERRLLVSITQQSDSAVELRIDGIASGSGTVPLPQVVLRQQNYVGRNLYPQCPSSFDGRIGEIVFYARGVSPRERDEIERYLSDKWEL